MGHEFVPVMSPIVGSAEHTHTTSGIEDPNLVQDLSGALSSGGRKYSSDTSSNPASRRCSPNFDTISPYPKRVVPVEVMSAGVLHDLVHKQDVLLVDTRSALLYNAEHVKGAINIPCNPSHSQVMATIGKLEGALANHDQQKFRQRDIATAVVVYDQSSTQISQFSRAGVLSKLLQEEGQVQALYILEGGFSKFATLYPDLCTRADGRNKEKMKRSLRKKLGKYYDLYMELTGDSAVGAGSNGGNNDGCASSRTGGPSEILPFLLLGSYEDARSVDLLQRHGVEYVLNMAEECPVWYPNLFTYHHCKAQDHADEVLSSYFDEAFTFIDRARVSSSRVLVHCHMGRSRAPTTVIAYLMREGYSLNDAYRLVAERRPQICPNRGFSMLLTEYENKLRELRSCNSATGTPTTTRPCSHESGECLFPPLHDVCPSPLRQSSDDDCGSQSSGR